jgi:mannose-6-phosphate isomerase-like protein (cupin superfamily)
MQTTFTSNLDQEFEQVPQLWSPRVIAAANGQYVNVARVKGEFVWHSHANEDEFFLVHKGALHIRYRDRADVVLGQGDFHVVPRGVEHMTAAPEECWAVLFEPATTEHAGDSQHERTVSIERQLAHLGVAPQQSRAQEI